MTRALALLLALTAQRGLELAIARRNTKRLLESGAYEAGADHYPTMVALHATWLGTLWIFGRKRRVVLPFAALFAVLQIGRVWVLATLGGRWTTRIIVTPGRPPITGGPFRFVRHPNYGVVALELPCVGLALGMPWHAALFGALNLAMLRHRIRVENAAYATLGAEPAA